MLGRRRRIALATIGALGAALALTGCGGDSDQAGEQPASSLADTGALYSQEDGGAGVAGAGDEASKSARRAASAQPESDQPESGATGTDVDADTATRQDASRKMIRTAQVEVRVADLPAAAVKVRAVATGLGGYVGSEDTSIPPKVDGEPRPESVATLLLRIPVANFDQAMNQVGGLGMVLHRTSNSQDVTEEVADLDSRVASQQASVQRVRAMMTEASTLKELVLLEGELSQRQADLEALQARLKSMNGKADLSSITVTLTQPGTVEPPAAEEKDGFLGALQNSLSALAGFGRGLLVLLGLLLPWLLVLGLIAAVGILIGRRLQRRAAAPATPPAVAPETASPPVVEPDAMVGAGPPSS